MPTGCFEGQILSALVMALISSMLERSVHIRPLEFSATENKKARGLWLPGLGFVSVSGSGF